MSEAYADCMHEALAQAERGKWQTYPNPSVGAVLVSEQGIVARGYHAKAGSMHAEVACLHAAKEAGIDPKGLTMVVTLEPCSHFGKTPPCTEALRAAGIRRVVFGMRDPTLEAAGGKEILESYGIEVIGPVLEQECQDMLADFLAWKKDKRPYILLKMAASMDGRIATRSGHSQWISCEASREHVHRLREAISRINGMVLVGGNTFRTDNPKLTVRTANNPKQPLAGVITSHLPKAQDAFALLTHRPTETIFFSSAACAASTLAQELRTLGVRVFPIPQCADGAADLNALFQLILAELHCPYVLCEGGGLLARSLLEANLVDEFHLHLAPIILADNSALPLFSGRTPLTLKDAIHLRTSHVHLCGDDVHILLRPKPLPEVSCSPASSRP
ncbi:MAG: bifunctional diaminohydroxyphosphoribosylaminopyrimidine deaminase/5-amino-6-(5-phosphoribosylamino)uracil reductase RibD [Desulfovibrio sp.]|nr:bifunctional diaminohydroxyphosphoribosylaminopyrimidine deaminase/5-amino-6-(5-phosphoribosylamino)uracil reductase RibD [Desulfovibrio sp.]